MSALQTDFDAEYAFVDGKTKLNGFELNRRFLSLHQRLNDVEVKGEGYDGLIAQGIGAALQRINDGVSPLLVTLLAQIDAAETALDLLVAQVAGGITASNIRLVTVPGLAATNVQDAVVEIQTKLNDGLATALGLAGSISARDLYFSGF